MVAGGTGLETHHPPCLCQSQAAPQAPSGISPCPEPHPPPACDAFSQVILRKGGLREPAFRPEDSSFLLFPTAFHTDARLLKPEARERYKQVREDGDLEFKVLRSGRSMKNFLAGECVLA